MAVLKQQEMDETHHLKSLNVLSAVTKGTIMVTQEKDYYSEPLRTRSL